MTKFLLMKKLYFSILLITCVAFNNCKAQYVTIPDATFAQWLHNNGYNACMSGNQLDTTCNAVLNATDMECYGIPIKDLTGVQYFKNLQTIDCSNDSIYTIPAFPPNLKSINCRINPLLSLPALPQGLVHLNCVYCQLTQLPALPASLRYLNLGHNPDDDDDFSPRGQYRNYMDSLPALPPGLQYLLCGQIGLQQMPAQLPPALLALYCDWNYYLTTLPPLPPNLQYIDCAYNSIDSLPPLPAALDTIKCWGNNLYYLPTLPAGLTFLNCSTNFISGLPALPDGLEYLDCSVNNFYNLPQLPQGLQYLYCELNHLTVIQDSLPYLVVFDCHYNQITTLPSLSPFLFIFDCSYNNLNSIPDLPQYLWYFSCDNNPNLTCLPQLHDISQLSFLNTQVVCLPNYGTIGQSTPPLSSLPLCGIFNPNGCQTYWNIGGRCFYDQNNDCAYNGIDTGTGYVKMQLYNGGSLQQQVYSGGQGFYSFNTLQPGSYTLQPDTSLLPFVVQCPDSGYYTATLSPADSLSYNDNFAFKCRTEGFDIGVQSTLNGYNVPRPDAVINLYTVAGDLSQLYGAHCAAGISGQVQITYSGPLAYVSPTAGALTPSSVNGDTITWNIADFGTVNVHTAFNLKFHISAGAVPGEQACFTVNVTPVNGDYNPSNNTGNFCFTIVDAIDPNEKEVSPAGTIDTASWLTYTIRFQNTGTAPAVNVVIADTLDASLDPSTFQLLAYSAPNLTQIFGNIVQFSFPNINLPDSATSDSASRGYVQFKIKLLNNLPLDILIDNTASIYFDQNAPVVTNTAENFLCITSYTDAYVNLYYNDSVLWNGIYYSAIGTYTDTLYSIYACDSVVTLHVINADSLNHYSGYIFLDLNNNGTWDAGEPPLANQAVFMNPQMLTTITDDSGYYNFTGNTGVPETIKPGSLSHAVQVPGSREVLLNIPGADTGNLNFGFQFTEAFSDVRVFATEVIRAVPGQIAEYDLALNNNGTRTESGTLIFIFDSNFVYSNSSPLGTLSGDTVKWNFSNLMPGATWHYTVQLHTLPIAPIETVFHDSAYVSIINHDSVPANNLSVVTDIILPDFDYPRNDKLLVSDSLNGDYFEYDIIFQNVFTATAGHVWIIDTLSPYFDISSLYIVGASAPYTFTLTGNVLRVDFNNINLPDSADSQIGSHGFFDFFIKPFSDTARNHIHNIAYIYFSREDSTSGGIADSLCNNLNISLSSGHETIFQCAPPEGGNLIVSATGGAPPYQYLWSNFVTSAADDGLQFGKWYVTVTDQCNTTVVGVTYIDSSFVPGYIGVISGVAPCYGSNNGWLLAMPCGGTGPFTFHWNTGSTSPQITNIGAGTYSCTITDAHGATVSVDSVLHADQQFYVTESSSTIGYCGLGNGSVSISGVGGNGTYSYLWSNGSTDSTLSNVPNGSYNFTVTDGNGCIDSGGIFYQSLSNLYFNDINVTFNHCSNTYNVQVSAGENGSVEGGPDFSVFLDSTLLDPNENYSIMTPGGEHVIYIVYTAQEDLYLGNGQYSFTSNYPFGNTPSDLGINQFCYADTLINLTYYPPTLSESISLESVACNGDYEVLKALVTGGSGNYGFSWDQGSSSGDSSVSFDTVSYSFGDGLYTCSITDLNTGCSTFASYYPGYPYFPLYKFQTNLNNVSCYNGNNGQIRVETIGGISPLIYQWSNGERDTATYVNDLNSPGIDTALAAGTYTCTVTDVMGCSMVDTFIITGPAVLNTYTLDTICNGDSVLFNGQYVNTTGTYTHQTSCDSAHVLRLTVITLPQTVIQLGLCAGDSFNFNGTVISAQGVYTDTLTSTRGCDSVVVLQVTILPLQQLNIYDTICRGDSILFNGNYIDTTGTYTAHYNSQNGCDSTVILHLNISIADTINQFGGLCGGDSVYFFGRYIYTPGYYDTILPSQTGCDTFATLSLVVIDPLPPTHVYDTICSGDSIAFNGSFINATGYYTGHFSSQISCDSIVILGLTVLPPVPVTYIYDTICATGSYNFYGQIVTNQGAYSHTLNSIQGCDSIITLNLSIFAEIPATYIYDTICQGNSVAFNGSFADTTGIYTAHYIPQNGCDSTVILQLTVKPVPVVSLSWDSLTAEDLVYPAYIHPDTGFCFIGVDPVITLAGGTPSGGTYTGFGIYMNTLYFDSFFNHNIYEYFLDTITYTVTVNGCSASASDMLVAEVCSGINEVNAQNLFTLYPNPTKDYVIIETDESATGGTIRLTDVTGREIAKLQVAGYRLQVNTNGFSAGVYFVTLNDKTGRTATQKLVIQ